MRGTHDSSTDTDDPVALECPNVLILEKVENRSSWRKLSNHVKRHTSSLGLWFKEVCATRATVLASNEVNLLRYFT